MAGSDDKAVSIESLHSEDGMLRLIRQHGTVQPAWRAVPPIASRGS
jgi:hypothetical protein